MRPVAAGLGIVLAAASFGIAPPLAAQQPSAAAATATATTAAVPLRVIPVRGNIYMISGAGGNVVASIGKDGVLLVDSGSAAATASLLATVHALDRQVTASGGPMRSCVGVVQGCNWWGSSNLLPMTVAPPAPKPIIGIINTSVDRDHIGGNAAIAAAGRTFGVRNLTGVPVGAWIVAHENVTMRLSPGGAPLVAATALPNEVYFGGEKKLNFVNGEGVIVQHIDAAHTDGDSLVYFRGSDVIAAGDVFNMAGYPVIDTANGGSIGGIVKAANQLLDVIVWEHMMEGGTMVIPGHGRLADVADVAYYRDMVTIARDRVAAMKKRGMTREATVAASLMRDYDPRWGINPSWTPAMFVDAIYRTLDGPVK
jgi:cyclase